MNDFIITILTSSAVSTIFLIISNIFIEQRKHSVEYITSERAKWRNDIRKIASEIMEADATNLYKPLTELKVRINAYDKYSTNKNIKNDSFIWECIEGCEICSEDTELLSIYKNNLVLFLSLMLKYDWERSKKEVSIDRNKVFKLFFYSMQITIFAIVTLGVDKRIYEAITLFSLYVLINMFAHFLMEIIPNICHKSIYIIRLKFLVHILTTIMIFYLTIVVFEKINIRIGDITLKDEKIKFTFSLMALFPTQIILILNLLTSLLSKYELKYISAILEQFEIMTDEIDKLLHKSKKKKRKKKK